MANDKLLQIENLRVVFELRNRTLPAVDDITIDIKSGETLGLVGESGCGKSVTASAVMGLIPNPPGRIDQGHIWFEGQDLTKVPESKMKHIRGNRISMIFQEPMTSLNPVFPVGDQVGEVIRLHQKLSRKDTRDKVIEMLGLVGIPSAERRVNDYPHQMSGGMRQRVMIAMALACNPGLLIADEPTTALDVTIQAQILDLMNELKSETEASILFITHDLGVIAEMAQTVAVMYAGKVMEQASVDTIFHDPKHPYTIGLLSSIPQLDEVEQRRLDTIAGVVPSLFSLPPGCRFQDRCPDVMDECRKTDIPKVDLGSGHQVRCLKYV